MAGRSYLATAPASREPAGRIDLTRESRSKSRDNGKLALLPSVWTEGCIRIKDGDTGFVSPIDFKERRYLLRAYNTPSRRLLLMTSRQTEKTTTVGNMMLGAAALRQNYSQLFVSPSATQTAVFSRTRIDDIIEISPHVKAMTHRSKTMNLAQKSFVNGSTIYLRSAFLSADRIRGISVNEVCGDEFQDLLSSVVPIIAQTTSHHKNSRLVWSGTPKTLDNTIEVYWSKHSTQSEWVIPCEHHGTPGNPSSWHWNVLGPKNLGLEGPICDRCGKPLNPEHPLADWHQMNPGAEYEGLRICRLMVPWFYKDPKKWKEILADKASYSQAQFYNEVLALSFDSGTKPLVTADIQRACVNTKDDNGNFIFANDEDQVAKIAADGGELYAGIDWAGGETENSYTVLSVGGYVGIDAKWQIVFKFRFDGMLVDPAAQMNELIRLLKKFRIKFIGTDFGGGFVQNKTLSSVFGPSVVHTFQYHGKLQAKIIYKPALHRTNVFRSPVIADYISAIKAGKIRFPAWDTMKTPYADDYTWLVSSYSYTQRITIYDKVPGRTDDAFHAGLYSLLVSLLIHKRPDIFAPMQELSPDQQAAIDLETRNAEDLMDQTDFSDEVYPGMRG